MQQVDVHYEMLFIIFDKMDRFHSLNCKWNLTWYISGWYTILNIWLRCKNASECEWSLISCKRIRTFIWSESQSKIWITVKRIFICIISDGIRINILYGKLSVELLTDGVKKYYNQVQKERMKVKLGSFIRKESKYRLSCTDFMCNE